MSGNQGPRFLWRPREGKDGWEQQEFPFDKESTVVAQRFGADFDDDEDTKPGIGNIFNGAMTGCHSGIAAPTSTYMRIEDKKPEQVHTWERGNGSSFVDAARNAASSSSHSAGVSQHSYSRDNFHSGSGMGYKRHEPETSDKIFIYDALPSSMMRTIMERDGFLALAKTEPKFKMYDIGRGKFPAMCQYGGTSITGEVYNAVPRTMKYLDSVFKMFTRQIISLEDGTRVWAYVTHYGRIPVPEILVPSGSWAEWKKGERERNRQVKEKARVEKEARDKAAAEETSRRSDWQQRFRSTTNNGKRRVHISTIKTIELRIMMNQNGYNCESMSEQEIRVECANRYGQWFMMDEDDTNATIS